LDGALLDNTQNAILKTNLINVVVSVIWEDKMAKMASLHAEGYTDADLETAEITESLLVD